MKYRMLLECQAEWIIFSKLTMDEAKGEEHASSTFFFKLLNCTCSSAKDLKNYNQLIRLMQFLIGLDDAYMTLRNNILTTKPLPDVKNCFLINF